MADELQDYMISITFVVTLKGKNLPHWVHDNLRDSIIPIINNYDGLELIEFSSSSEKMMPDPEEDAGYNTPYNDK